ncbi:hypothetical protein JB92DRAFT_2837502 [Gautieria morchelliformis]|nr:hypothetical protein JB92DRAFT_2837502 [Gautieria morchelliformis]
MANVLIIRCSYTSSTAVLQVRPRRQEATSYMIILDAGMSTPDTEDTVSSPNDVKVIANPEHVNVSSKAAKVLGFQIDPSSVPANKKKAARHGARRSKPTQSIPGMTDLEAAHPRTNTNADGQSSGRTEEILRKILSRRRNVVICIIFLLSVVVSVSVVSGFQGKGSEGRSPESSTQDPPAPSSNASIVNVSSQARAYAASPSTHAFVRPSQVGVGGGQSTAPSSP